MKTIASMLLCLSASALLTLSLQVRAADPLPPPPQMPEAITPSAPQTSANPKSEANQTDVKGTCVNCAVIRSIRQVEHERASPRQVPNYIDSSQYRESVGGYGGSTVVGPVVGFTFGPGSNNQAFVGAAGSPAMRQRLMQITYEVILRFDDGRYGLLELDDASDYRVGDHVRVVDNLLEPLPRQ